MNLELPQRELSKASKPEVPGEEGVWVVIFGEMIVFSILFAVFLDARQKDAAAFEAGRAALDLTLGVVNTLILLTSSFAVAAAVDLYRKGDAWSARALTLVAALLGLGFCITKAFEYKAKLAAGAAVFDNPFHVYYFLLTGLHLVHVIVGIGILLTMSAYMGRPGHPARQRLMESGGLFWHLVDLLWIVIFPLLYILH